MSFLKYKSLNADDLKSKSRVYFCCHHDDFSHLFDEISNDIFKVTDCVLYYTDDAKYEINDENKSLDLYSMNMFVVPITTNLLTTKNRAMDVEIKYAVQQHIPILPIIVEAGLDQLYKEKFGDLQYIDRYTEDETAIPYQVKLEKFLKTILLNDESIEKIHNCFDATIFLSYRKKDRALANSLMGIIHSEKRCRSIAIWYDEYLIPGESFNDSIQMALNNSDLFTLLVTPNLINEENYILTTEYPLAKKANKIILPIEMQKTDSTELGKLCLGIPEICLPNENVGERVLDAVGEKAACFATQSNEKIFYLGLAYINGVDVECNREYGVEFITEAANNSFPEAMECLHNYYLYGENVAVDWEKALFWAKKCFDFYKSLYGVENEKSIKWMENIASMCSLLCFYKEHLEIGQDLYNLYEKLYGKSSEKALIKKSELLIALHELGYLKEADNSFKELESIVDSWDEVREEYQNSVLNNVFSYLVKVNKFEEALNVSLRVSSKKSSVSMVFGLVNVYCGLKQYKEAFSLCEQLHVLYEKWYGKKSFEFMSTKSLMISILVLLQDYDNSLKMFVELLGEAIEVFGETHPFTLNVLDNLAALYEKRGEFEDAVKAYELEYEILVEKRGEKNPDTVKCVNCLINCYRKTNQTEKAFDFEFKMLKLIIEDTPELSSGAMASISRLVQGYSELGRHDKVAMVRELELPLVLEKYGPVSEQALYTYNDLGYRYFIIKRYEQAKDVFQKAYDCAIKVNGKTHLHTIMVKANYCNVIDCLGDKETAFAIRQDVIREAKSLKLDTEQFYLTALKDQADLCEELNKYQEAFEAYLELYSFFKNNYEEDHIEAVRFYFKIARLRFIVGQRELAVQACDRYLDYRLPADIADVAEYIYKSVGMTDKSMIVKNNRLAR